MIARGCKFAWLFTYIPVGKDAVSNLLVTPEQREFMYKPDPKLPQNQNLCSPWISGMTENMSADASQADAAISTSTQPAISNRVHSSTTPTPISRKKTLLEALKSPLFMQYRKNQPFNENFLRPCPLLDNPERLTAMVHASGAKSTDLQHPEDVDVLCGRCVNTAAKWKITADRLWYGEEEEQDAASNQ